MRVPKCIVRIALAAVLAAAASAFAEEKKDDSGSAPMDVATALNDKAKEIIQQLMTKSIQYMNWYCSLSPVRFNGAQNDCMYHLYIMQHLLQIADSFDTKFADKIEQQLDVVLAHYHQKGGSLGL